MAYVYIDSLSCTPNITQTHTIDPEPSLLAIKDTAYQNRNTMTATEIRKDRIYRPVISCGFTQRAIMGNHKAPHLDVVIAAITQMDRGSVIAFVISGIIAVVNAWDI